MKFTELNNKFAFTFTLFFPMEFISDESCSLKMRVSSGFFIAFSNVGAEALIRWYFMLSLVLVVIIHIHSDKWLKVTFVLSVVIIPTPRVDFAPLPELYKQQMK